MNRSITATIFLSIVLFAKVDAQDTHYWTQQYGPKSSLLSGSDAATSRDNSAIYNNPGGLGFNTIPNLSITTNAYSLSSSLFRDYAGKDLDMQSIQPNNITLILSGVYKDKKHKRWTVGYALIDKARYKFEGSQRFDGSLNALSDNYSPGNEEFVSQLDLNNSLSEIWGGLTLSYKINDKIAVGLSEFGAYRERKYSYNFIARTIANTGSLFQAATSNFLYNVDYLAVRMISKVGVSVNLGKVNAGLAVTLPSINLYSEATMNGDLTGTNVLIDPETSERGTFIANDRQDNLKARYKSSWSISGGLSTSFKATKIYLTGEYFGGISPYVYVQPQVKDFIRPKGIALGSNRELLSVSGGALPVYNIALGMEQKLFKEYSLLLGASTDNSFFDPAADNIGNQLSFTSANLLHGSIGVMANRPKNDICVGVSAAYGKNKVQQAANINQPVDGIMLMGETTETEFRYYSIAVIIGYVHYIK